MPLSQGAALAQAQAQVPHGASASSVTEDAADECAITAELSMDAVLEVRDPETSL